MEQTLLRYVALYNHQLLQSPLGSKTLGHERVVLNAPASPPKRTI